VLLSTYGSRGDVEPMVALAVRLQALGAQVRMCAPPNFTDLLARAGVPHVRVGQSALRLASGTPADLFADQLAAVKAIAMAAEGCDAVVASGMMPAAAGARSVAEKQGIRFVYAAFQQLILPSPHQPPLLYPGRPFAPERPDADDVNAMFRDALNTFRASLELPPVDDVRNYVRHDVFGDCTWLATDQTLDPWQPTPDLDVVQTGAWLLPDDRPLPDDLEAFLNAGPPPVYIGFGSVPVAADIARAAIEAARAHGRRVLLAGGWAGLQPIDDRDDCRTVGEVNHQRLFERVAAVVHHGGGGTTATAAVAGVPQVVVPQAADQPYWAGRVAQLGIGAAHDGPRPTVATLSDALTAALHPETRARAAAVAADIRTDGATVAAKWILDDGSARYDGELQSEQRYVARLYRKLDAERARVKDKYSAALRSPIDKQDGGTLVDRDAEVRATARQMNRLNVADFGLCFGRLDSVDDEQFYIGRIGLFDEDNDYEPLLLDWRAPASRAFYVATAAHPENMRRRRQFHSRGRQLVDFTDEEFGRPDAASSGDAALLAAVNAPRGEGMRDIVATIQAEQDDIIRSDHSGVLVIEGGPGTGKTVVALHRVAYLLYTQRERMERHGVLVVGPNSAFLNHISRVLPSLGETNVVFTTTGDLVPGLHVTAEEDDPDVARLKGSLAILDMLAAAIADRQRTPVEPLAVELSDVTVRIDAETAQWAIEEARATGLPHNEARATFVDIVTYVLTERATARVGKGWLTREDRGAWDNLRDDLTAELADNPQFAAALDELWPILTPQTLLAQLYESRDRLHAAGADESLWRADGRAWTVSDLPLLDELVDLLGPDKAADRSVEREQRAAAEYAAGVLDIMIDREDLMDDEDHLLARDLIYAEDLADRFLERDTRELAERAAADRNWTYRHVVVDEAQELSEMDWRVLMRRCPNRSFTIVGDLAQRRSPAGATSWESMLEPYVPGRWVYRPLSVNYRTPAEIMAVAAALLAEIAPGVEPPESVRASGVQPWAMQVTEDEMGAAIQDFIRDEAGRAGTSVVIGPADVPGAVPPSQTKGLEFDAVLVVEPERILAESPRGGAELYVALTRATQRLGVLHREALPEALTGLVETQLSA
jgi:DNA helicase IV/UDP:flavonoid glycosyltransferase YjiC (YdhE family)